MATALALNSDYQFITDAILSALTVNLNLFFTNSNANEQHSVHLFGAYYQCKYMAGIAA
jgi:hypothetical protein